MIQNRATWGKQGAFLDKTILSIRKSMTLLLKLQSFLEHSHASSEKKINHNAMSRHTFFIN